MPKVKVLFVAGELNPLAKVGGLGDVIGALPKSLLKAGVDARIVIPKYGIIDEKKYSLKIKNLFFARSSFETSPRRRFLISGERRLHQLW